MNYRSALASASAFFSVLAVGGPAHAVYQSDHGWSCGMTAASVDGHTWHGTMWGGPWFVEPADDVVSIACSLQQWTGEGWVTIASSRSAATPGVAVLPPTPTTFMTPIGPIDPFGEDSGIPLSHEMPTNLQMCTEITIYRDPTQPPDVHPVDADDDPSNGAQCEKGSRADGDLVYVAVFPPRRHSGDRCVWIDDEGLPEQVSDEYCVMSPV